MDEWKLSIKFNTKAIFGRFAKVDYKDYFLNFKLMFFGGHQTFQQSR